jgi:hypothetical protein
MRSYIFTARERALIRRVLEKRISLKHRSLEVILSRLRHFKQLAGDVELYVRLRRLAESEGAVST